MRHAGLVGEKEDEIAGIVSRRMAFAAFGIQRIL
jgi:hypothetical protein